MNIVDYASLQTAVADWLNRSDLSARIPDFIGLAEVRLMDELTPLRLLESEESFTPATGSRTQALPADFREPLNLWYDNGADREPLRFIPADLMDVWDATGRPFYWTIDQGNIAFERPTDAAYGMTFRYVVTLGLSGTVATNAVLTQYPNLYLFASLVEAAPYLKDKDALTTWEERLQQAIANAKKRQSRMMKATTLSSETAPLSLPRGRGGFNVFRGY